MAHTPARPRPPRATSGQIDDFLALVLRRLPAFVWTTDADLNLTFVRGPLGTRGEQFFADAFERNRALFAPLSSGESVRVEVEWNRRWYHVQCEPVYDEPNTTLAGTIGVGIDITQRHQLEQQLASERAFLAKAEEIAQVGSWNLEFSSGAVTISPGLERMTGLKGPILRDFDALLACVHPDDRVMVETERAKAMQLRVPLRIIHRIVLPNGSVRHVIARCDCEFDEEGRATQSVGTVLDITERVEAERAIEHLAYHDPLTRLPNRWLLNDRLTQNIAIARRERRSFYVLFIDLDRFKEINDTLGHSEGDVLLIDVATRLHRAVRETDTVARSGGDEFVVLLRDVEDSAQGHAAIDKVRSIFNEPFVLQGLPRKVTASIGVAMYPDDGLSEEELLAHADTAMYDSKESGRNAVRRYRVGSVDLSGRRISIAAEVRDGIEGGQFYLEYQPIVDAYTHQIVAAEALLRWNHPAKGVLQPSDFLDQSNSRDFITAIGEWVLEEAFAQAARWRRESKLNIRLAVNVQPRHMQSDRAYIELLEHMLQKHDLPARAIELELTERTIVRDMDWAVAVLGEVRELGFNIAIDDFGTGYNSLNYLKLFPVTTLKIDRSFIAELGRNSFDEALTRAVATLGKARGLRVVAEGVETAQQSRQLVTMDCDELQGFFFSKPLKADAFAARYS